MPCNQCEATVNADEQEEVEDNFNLPIGICLCYTCAEAMRGQEDYMRRTSYDVETPFADNH